MESYINNIVQDFSEKDGRAEELSEVFERDSRRYSRAFTEEEQVKLRWN